MDMMPSRYEGLAATLAGYEQSRVPLVALADGRYVASGFNDNQGLHYVVPPVAEALGIPLDTAINVVLYGTLIAGFAIGLVGMLCLFRTFRQRVAAVAQFTLLGGYALFAIHDVYVFGIAVTLAVVPWGLLLLRNGRAPQRAAAFCLLAGIMVGLAQQFRAQSGLAAGLFVMLLIWLTPALPVRWRCALTTVFCGAALLPGLWFQQLAADRDAFLSEHGSSPASGNHLASRGAPWHSIYIGFGFLSNPYVSHYQDEVAIARVDEVRPGTAYLSREYNEILRREVLGLVRAHPGFVLRTLSAKAGALLFWVLLFGNLGLISMLARPAWQRQDAAFAVAGLVAAAPGLLVMPLPHYVSNLLALAAIYGTIQWNRGDREAGGARLAAEPAAA